MSISTIMLTPGSDSRGSVKLNTTTTGTGPSTDPFAHPIIDAGLLLSPTDVPLMREAVKSILRFASASAWEGYITSPASSSQPVLSSSDAEIDAFIRQNTRSAYHVVGTSGMAPKGAPTGVTDPDLKVKGVEGVRVVDASVLVSSVFFRNRIFDAQMIKLYSHSYRRDIRRRRRTRWRKGLRI